MVNEILKPVPHIDDLLINHDGTVVYYRDKLRTVRYVRSINDKKYKYLNIGPKRYFISRLVFAAFIGDLPKSRTIQYIDGNHLNTNYRNLWPKKCVMAELTDMKKVPGYDDLYINANGTVICQYGFEISIRIQKDYRKNTESPAACVRSAKKTIYTYVDILVAMAWLNYNGNGKIFHIDKNIKNNHFSNLHCLSMKEYGKWASHFLKGCQREPRPRAIPDKDIDEVKERLLKGESLRKIAEDYKCSDMAIVRFKKRHFNKDAIDAINKANGVNTVHTPKHLKYQIIKKLKKGVKQIDVAKEFDISPTIICRINRKYIKEIS